MKHMNRIPLALAVLAMTFLSACLGVKKPEVDLENVSVGSLGLSGGTLNVDVRVKNPNTFGVKAQRLNYDLFLRRSGSGEASDTSWVSFAKGTYDEDIEVGAGQTRTVRIPVNFSYSQLGTAARELLRNGRFDYRAAGDVDVRTTFGSRNVPFRKTGTFYLSGNSR